MGKDTLPLEDEAVGLEPETGEAVGKTIEAEVVELPDNKPAATEPTNLPAAPQPVSVQNQQTEIMRTLWIVAERVAGTEFVPKEDRGKPDKVFAKFLAGQELGIGPMSSLKHFSMINGKPFLSAEATLALIRRAGHKADGEATSQYAEVTGTRADTQETMTVKVTLDDALAAGWIDSIDETDDGRKARAKSKGAWEHHTEAMLWARAVTKLQRRLFPDSVLGWFAGIDNPVEEL